MKDYLFKSGISATVKRYKKNNKFEVKGINEPGFFYLAFDNKNRLHTYINFHDQDTGRHYNLQISRYYLMEAVLHSLMIRPIRRPNDYNFWVNKTIFEQLDIMPENLNYETAVEYNHDALRRIRSWLYLGNLSTKEKMVAKQQYNLIKDRLKSIDFIDPSTSVMAMTTLGDIL